MDKKEATTSNATPEIGNAVGNPSFLSLYVGKHVTVYLSGGQTLEGRLTSSELSGRTVLDKGEDGEILIATQGILACWVWRKAGA